MYHSISNVSGDRFAVKPEQFAGQMQVLAGLRFDVVSLEEGYRRLSSAKDLARTVVLTFDDGHGDFLTAAAPILAARCHSDRSTRHDPRRSMSPCRSS